MGRIRYDWGSAAGAWTGLRQSFGGGFCRPASDLAEEGAPGLAARAWNDTVWIITIFFHARGLIWFNLVELALIDRRLGRAGLTGDEHWGWSGGSTFLFFPHISAHFRSEARFSGRLLSAGAHTRFCLHGEPGRSRRPVCWQAGCLPLEFGHLGRPDRGEEGLGFFQAAAAPTIVS